METISKVDAIETEIRHEMVPRCVFDSTIARFERTIRRLVILIGITIVLLFATNAMWIYEWNQYDYSDVTVDSQDGGNANYIGASGYINNGESTSKKKN